MKKSLIKTSLDTIKKREDPNQKPMESFLIIESTVKPIRQRITLAKEPVFSSKDFGDNNEETHGDLPHIEPKNLDRPTSIGPSIGATNISALTNPRNESTSNKIYTPDLVNSREVTASAKSPFILNSGEMTAQNFHNFKPDSTNQTVKDDDTPEMRKLSITGERKESVISTVT